VIAEVDENGNLKKIVACGEEKEGEPDPNYCKAPLNPASQEKQEKIDHDNHNLWPHFHPQVLRWEGKILEWAEKFGLEPNLVATVMQIESCGDPNAVSEAGAQGLFQVMPFNFKDGQNMTDPENNAKTGLSILKRLWEEAQKVNPGNLHDQVIRTLAGYNGGMSQVNKNWQEWDDETKRYISWGVRIFEDAQQGADKSEALESWLQMDGGRLCPKDQSQ